MLPRILTRVVDCVRAHRQFGVELATHSSATWVHIRTWKSEEFVRVAVAIIDRYYVNPNFELAIWGKILRAVDSGASLVSRFGGSHTLVDCHRECLGSGYTETLVDYSIFNVWLLKRCFQKTASAVFVTLDPFPWQSSLLLAWRGRCIETGCTWSSLFEWPLRRAIYLFPDYWMLSVTWSVCGYSLYLI